MKVTVLLGEPLWRQVGQRELEIDLAPSARVGDLVGHLAAAYPALGPWLDGAEVPPTIFLDDGAEVPPTIFLDEAVADALTPLHEGARPMLAWALAGG